MVKAVSSPILQLIRQVVEDQCMRDASDQHLVQRFSDQRDEAAFHTLLRRHGPMVLDVCRGVLGNEANAEDAFQATFLILARKAASIRKAASVGCWLHGVAYRTALNARTQSATRQKCEARAPVRQLSQPDDLTWRELREVLHQELTGLAERYRAPLVMCYLEGKTQDQAAAQLRLAKSTLKERLERGRGLLRARLVRRGLGPALLVAAAWPAAIASACLPSMLVSSTVKAAGLSAVGKATVGVISTKVAALAEGVMKSMLLTKLKTAAAVLLVSVVITAGAVSLGFAQRAAFAQQIKSDGLGERDKAAGAKATDGPTKPSPAEKLEADAKGLARGQVLGPDGKPFAGAKLYLAYPGTKQMTYPVRATSGDDGRFEFTFVKSGVDNTGGNDLLPQVMAVAKGHGCDWVTVALAEVELSLRLVTDVPLDGRILDSDGRPVPGARLTVISLSAAKGDDLGEYLKAKGEGYAFAKHWEGPLPGQPAVLTAGPDGRFRLDGAGRERVVHFRVEGPGIATAGLIMMTRVAEPVKSPEGWTLAHGAKSDYVGHATRPIRGVVRDKETGKPLAGVSVSQYYSEDATNTDKEGRYELIGLQKSEHYYLRVKPADGLYFERQVELQGAPGFGALTCDVELARWLTVRGRVTDKATGKPVAGARVDYHPLGGNAYVDKLIPGYSRMRAEAATGVDGSYALTVLPGPGVIGVSGPRWDKYMPAAVTRKERKDFFKTSLVGDDDEYLLNITVGGGGSTSISLASYNAIILLEPGDKDAALVKDEALELPQERTGRVVGPDGQPLTGVTVCGLGRGGVETLKGDEFVVRGINPKANRPLVFYHKDKNLGFFVKEMRGDTPGPLTVKLKPCGSTSGRVVDQDGQAVAGLRLSVQGRALRILGHEGGGYQAITTDKEGRFRAEGLVPGQEYMVSEERITSFPRVYAQALVEPGKHQDLGNIKMAERGD
jgi:RNA polymerase sigma factor (sigma-70 family)